MLKYYFILLCMTIVFAEAGIIDDEVQEIIRQRAEDVRTNQLVYQQDASLSGIIILPELYENRDFKPVWTNSDNIDGLFKLIREMELEVLSGLDADRHLIVDTGGGVVETPEAVALLKKRGVIIWLDAPWEIIRERLRTSDTSQRPLIERLGWAGMADLYRQRRPLYAAAGDFRLPCRVGTATDIARTAMLRSLIWERRQEGKR